MKIAVLGAGAGGTAVAFDCAQAGHAVSLFDFPNFPDNIDAIAKVGGIRASGDANMNGFAPLVYAGHDIDQTMDQTELIYVVGPAYSTEPFGKVVAGKLRGGQTVIIMPGSCGGALAFLRAAKVPTGVRLAETSTLHYAVRLIAPGEIRVFLKLKAGNLLAAFHATDTLDVLALVGDVYGGMEPAESVLQTSLQNANPIIHPAVSLTNAARIEMTNGDFLFYEQGVSDSVGNIILALDKERIAIGAKLGLKITTDPDMGVRQGYMKSANYGTGYRQAPGFTGIKAQNQLDHRYINEDVGYGLVFMTGVGSVIGVPTPTMDAIIQVASIVMGRDYKQEAKRTPETLGISDLLRRGKVEFDGFAE